MESLNKEETYQTDGLENTILLWYSSSQIDLQSYIKFNQTSEDMLLQKFQYEYESYKETHKETQAEQSYLRGKKNGQKERKEGRQMKKRDKGNDVDFTSPHNFGIGTQKVKPKNKIRKISRTL